MSLYHYNTPCSKLQEVLQKISIHKSQQADIMPIIISAYEQTSHVTSERLRVVSDCGSYIRLNAAGKVTGANFCHLRVCPICAWRKSLQVYGKYYAIQDYLSHQDNYNYILVTLTIRNVKRLADGLQQLTDGYKRLSNDRELKRISCGYIRTMEISYNYRRDDYHPHLHILYAMSPQYYSREHNNYKSQDWWRERWERCARLDYVSQVDVRAVRADGQRGAIAEIAKYALKPLKRCTERYNGQLVGVYTQLLEYTHHRRLQTMGGVFRSAAKHLKIDIDADDEFDRSSSDDITYIWRGGEYIQM